MALEFAVANRGAIDQVKDALMLAGAVDVIPPAGADLTKASLPREPAPRHLRSSVDESS